ncbi:MAG TPA: hypothetical protein VG738_05820 [Chitinophagaceae bacterium]|nr:hypothetical protein [Chitinophagaceae bacterium]
MKKLLLLATLSIFTVGVTIAQPKKHKALHKHHTKKTKKKRGRYHDADIVNFYEPL